MLEILTSQTKVFIVVIHGFLLLLLVGFDFCCCCFSSVISLFVYFILYYVQWSMLIVSTYSNLFSLSKAPSAKIRALYASFLFFFLFFLIPSSKQKYYSFNLHLTPVFHGAMKGISLQKWSSSVYVTEPWAVERLTKWRRHLGSAPCKKNHCKIYSQIQRRTLAVE